MSEGIPKSARDALAKQTAADAHPSPDLLNAYVEQSLGDEESAVVLGHLAACSECREVIFLTSGVAEEELLATAAKDDLASMRVRMPAEALPARLATAMPQAARMPGVESRPQTPRRWWKWAVPAFAAVIAVGVGVLERDNIRDMMSPAPPQMAKVERPTVALRQSNTPVAKPESHAEVAQSQTTVADHEKILALPPAQKKELAERDRALKQRQDEILRREQTELASNLEVSKDKRDTTAGALAAGEPKSAAAVAAPPPPPAQKTVEVTSAAPLVQADNADLSTNYAQSLAKSAMPSNSAAGALGPLQTQRAAPTHWRISSDGHVERAVGPSTWERVMSAEPVIFHVVATVGQNVWAGGSEGALFRSTDGGHEWNRVALAGEQGTVKTIHFNNAQQGSLTTETGTVWTTSDGGATWSKQ